MAANTTDLEKRLWDAADELRANSKLKSSEYSVPVLGLIFLRYADWKFTKIEQELKSKGSGRRGISKTDYQAKGVMYLPEEARFSYLINLSEDENFGKKINDAMKAIEKENKDLEGALPNSYTNLDNELLVELLKKFNKIDFGADLEGDTFGTIYQYFLSKFAMSEGQKGGEFFTPTSIVKLIVEILEPYHGRIYDPTCGSGGMFVQSAKFIERHKKNPSTEISIYGQEKVEETVNLCQMNLAVHGLSGEIKQGNTYYEVNHANIDIDYFDFLMANPPFNVDKVDKEKMKGDIRFKELGLPKTDNANYIWINLFYSSLNETGRAGFVMANSASDARSSELEIRKKLIQISVVDVMVAVGSNFFYTVTLPCTLWFFDRGKRDTIRKNKVLFIDARHIFTQIDRAHREFTAEQIEFIANIVRLYRGEAVENNYDSEAILQEKFPECKYIDVAGLCKVATINEIEAQGWSLNPGRYVGVADKVVEDFDFAERLEELNEELEVLNVEARELEERIGENVTMLLEG
ncbi:SAM-dependent DNA methyltransferase [Anabaena sp. UHCC 0253]|uniref:type I restriction-modification system subunit M n=1 Tax=Anabaena sp. UHCC 0253 TaxID=2590019 RepID=UPI001447DD9A|nr:class I SAM-dependent DNA methyltransferase [Anabaena sp. UHCC 0253]MTJ56069.1 SAM-dependent DNA methyltransferase [Anabaena sp. UHCC 0253]